MKQKQCECGALLPSIAEVCIVCGCTDLLPVVSHDRDDLTREQAQIERLMRENRGIDGRGDAA